MNKTVTAIMVFSLFFLNAAGTHSHDLIIGLSPYMDKTAAKEQIKKVIGYLLEEVEPGNSARIYDAYQGFSLGTFAVPDKPAYRHQKAKLIFNKKVVKALLQFADNAVKPGGENMPSITGAISLPQFLRFLGENLSLKEETDVLILGSPLYDRPGEQEFSMAKGHVPSDGHLQVSLGKSPFGMTGDYTLLQNFRVHLAYIQEYRNQPNHHMFFVKRFWSLFLEQQGGRLLTFTGDLPTLFQRVSEKTQAPRHDYVLKQSSKLEMILYRPKEIKKRVSIYDRPLSRTPIPLAAVRNARDVEVSITWDCKICDLDLYARPSLQAETLFFRHPESQDGRYIKDFRDSPRLSNSFETIIFHKPIDLRELVLAVNFYAGKVPDRVNGEFRISVSNKTFAHKFQIKARGGNIGACIKNTLKNRRAAGPHCLIIDPLKVIGINR